VIPPISAAIGPLGPAEWSVGSVPPVGTDPTAAAAGAMAPNAPAASSAVDGTTAADGSSFSGALTNAIGALEQSQTKGASAAQALATGQATDPTQAVTAVENASLEMQLASQIRTKLDEAATTVFQTQV
jgi:flagellar hook-basal body complex protein FliE